MNERTKKIITAIVVIVIFVVCIGLIIVGQRNIGPKGLLTEIVGLQVWSDCWHFTTANINNCLHCRKDTCDKKA